MSDHLGARFTEVEQIGGGNYGSLYRVIDSEAATPANRIIAAKRLKAAVNHPHVLREVSVQRHAQECSPHIVKLFHVVPRDEVRTALVLEYVPLDLRAFLRAFHCEQPTSTAAPSSSHLPLPYVRRLLRGLVEALHCLHARGIAHRDVKPENILVEPLGLRHPLRCVCPPVLASPGCTASAGHCCVHAPHAPPPPPEAAGDPGEAVHQPGALEPCRAFLGGAVALHHELGSEELLTAIHRLHCHACRPSAHAMSGEDADAPLSVNGNGGGGEAAAAVAAVAPLSPDVKLCDFGSARHIGALRLRSAEEQRAELTPGPTTPVYCAPEMMLLQRYGTAVDMWAVGAILYEMVTGEVLLDIGTLRSFSGDVVVRGDYCVVHRLHCMFCQLGTPTVEEWGSIAHPHYYPTEVLAQLPQVRRGRLFARASPEEEEEEQQHECAHERPPAGLCESQPEAVASESADESADGTAAKAASRRCEGRGAEPPSTLLGSLHRHIGADGVDFLRGLLRYDPATRLTSAAALRHSFLSPKTGAT
ncbi:Cell division protein kinase [Novymonas esmeraldas]|uniref:Cell division protein kinase n=1 Tax=Novymonas esmeraldas TaxID=1808958 RepID=A0AAW0EV22_9TRYP